MRRPAAREETSSAAAGGSSRRDFVWQAGIGALGLLVAPRLGRAAPWTERRPLVIDALGGLGRPGEETFPLSAGALADAAASGVAAINLTVAASPDYEEAVRGIAQAQAEVERHRDRLLLVRRASAIEEAHATGRLGIILGFQDGAMIGDRRERLDEFHGLGVRVIQPTYNRRNAIGDGCMEPENHGLTPFGRTVVERMNELGILVDLSHCGQATTRDGIALSKVPVAVTHAGCAAVVDHPRNKRDAELRALAERGGVVGIYWMPYLRRSGQPTSADLLAHLEHALQVCGEDHVGIGSDLSLSPLALTPAAREAHRKDVEDRRRRGIAAPGEDPDVFLYLPDLNSARRELDLAELLAKRGHPDRVIEKILGANFLRLFRETWKA
ncbi:MAG: dipeptidase [Acidobacteriota bacterium]